MKVAASPFTDGGLATRCQPASRATRRRRASRRSGARMRRAFRKRLRAPAPSTMPLVHRAADVGSAGACGRRDDRVTRADCLRRLAERARSRRHCLKTRAAARRRGRSVGKECKGRLLLLQGEAGCPRVRLRSTGSEPFAEPSCGRLQRPARLAARGLTFTGSGEFTEIFELAEPGQASASARRTGCDRRVDPVLRHRGAANRCRFTVAQRFTAPR